MLTVLPGTASIQNYRLNICRQKMVTPNLPTKILPTKIRWLKTSRKSPMDMSIPLLKTKIMLESNPMKSWISAGRPALELFWGRDVSHAPRGARTRMRVGTPRTSQSLRVAGCKLEQPRRARRMPKSWGARLFVGWSNNHFNNLHASEFYLKHKKWLHVQLKWTVMCCDCLKRWLLKWK